MKEKDRLTPEMRKKFSLIANVRSMLRRNYTLMFTHLEYEMTDERLNQMIANTEIEALDFVLTLQTLLLFMTEEEACDYLDGLKHIVTG